MNVNIDNIIASTMRVQRVHLTKKNSSRRERSGHDWVTVTNIRDRVSDDVLATGKSYCNTHDNPSRKIGRAIADGRAVKQLKRA